MKEGWKIEKLDKIGKIVSGATPRSNVAEYWDGDILWLTPKDLGKLGGEIYITASSRKITALGLKSCSSQLMPKGSIIMSSRAPIGHLGIAADVICTNQGCKSIVPNENMVSKFVYYYLLKSRKELNSLGTGAVFPEISGRIFGAFEIPVPPLSEQQKIVEKLDTAFDLIDRAKANIEKNIHNAKELFQSKLNQVFSEKGEGWEEVELAKVCTMKRGHNPPKSKFIYEPKEGYVRFYQIRDGSSEKNAVYVPDTPQLQRVEPDDILMVAYRHVGRAFRGVSGCFNVALCKISNNDQSVLDNDFLFYLIPSDVIRGELLKHSERSLIPSMSVEHLKKLAIPLPPINEQKAIVELLNIFRDSTDALIYKYQQKLNNLEEMKKSILEKAFKGELI